MSTHKDRARKATPATRGTPSYVSEFIRRVHQSIQPASTARLEGFWLSRRDEGSLFFDSEERTQYIDVVERLEREFAKGGDLSRKSIERYLQNALFDSLDLNDARGSTFEERLAIALTTLKKSLDASPIAYRCLVPVNGLAADDLPFGFGGIRFVAFGNRQLRELRQLVRRHRDPQALAPFIERLKGGWLWGQICAVVVVEARDFGGAQARASVRARTLVDCLNFFHDLIPHNFCWLYFPSEGGPSEKIAPIIAADGAVSVPFGHIGPRGSFSIQNLRKAPALLRHFGLGSDLLRCAKPRTAGEVILTSLRWAGRASVEVNREQSFLLFAIALESVVLPEQKQELRYRLGLRVSRLLGRARGERHEIAKLVEKLYDIRSKTAHSGSYEVTEEELGRLRALTKRAILKLLKRRALWAQPTSTLEQWLEGRVSA